MRGTGHRKAASRLRHGAVFAAVPLLLLAALAPPGYASAAYQQTIGQPGQSELHPGGIDVDDAGNVYAADTGNDRIAKYSAASTSAAWVRGARGAPREQGSFADPRDIAVSATHLYVADNGTGIVQGLDL